MKFKVQIVATIDSPSAAQATADAQRIQKLLDQQIVKVLLGQQGVMILDVKIDPRVVPA